MAIDLIRYVPFSPSLLPIRLAVAIDRLDALFQGFSTEAHVFHTGLPCGSYAYEAEEGAGHLHLVNRGGVTIHNPKTKGKPVTVAEPAVVFYPRPMVHRLVADRKAGLELVCASVRFGGGAANLVIQALPPFLVIPIRAMDNLGPATRLRVGTEAPQGTSSDA